MCENEPEHESGAEAGLCSVCDLDKACHCFSVSAVFLFRCPAKHVPDEDEHLLLLREPFITRGEILELSVDTICDFVTGIHLLMDYG